MSTSSYKTYSVEGYDTIVKLFRHRVQQLGNRTAMREKNLGIWESYSWTEYGKKARIVGMALLSLGLKRGDICSILSENNKEWLYFDMGNLCVGGVTNGVYTTDSKKQLAYLLNDSKSKFLVVENEEQLDKFLEVREQVPTIQKVIVLDQEGLHDFHDENVLILEEFYELGREFNKDHGHLWDQEIDKATPDDLMVLVYTSGTTGAPKGSMVTHANCMYQIDVVSKLWSFTDRDETLSFLPLCHMLERLNSILLPLGACYTINFIERPDTVPENIRELSPTVFIAVPRFWEKFYASISLKSREATLMGKLAFKAAFKIADAAVEYRIENKPLPLGLSILYWIAKKLVLNNIRRMLGLDRIRLAGSGSAPISPDLIKWYFSLGVDMVEGYGQTEATGMIASALPENPKLGTIGRALPGCEVRISEEGEILVRGPNVFLGYLNNPEKTAETVVDGWLRTGDVGKIDDEGFVTITDRMKDIIITAGGKNITPSEIENQLKFSPFITDAIVIGDKKKYLTGLIMIDQENVENFAQENDIPYTNFTSLCNREEVCDLIWEEVVNVNKLFARVEQLKKIRLIDQLLTAEDDELTPTMKLKRSFVNKKYKDLIDSMY